MHNEDNFPNKSTIWLLFDLANGNRATRNYTWWFDTRKKALEHKKHQNMITNYAQLSGPVKVLIDIKSLKWASKDSIKESLRREEEWELKENVK